MSTQYPAPPAPKKVISTGWRVVLVGLVAIIGISFASTYGSNNTVVSDPAPVSAPYQAPQDTYEAPDDLGITAEMIVDAMPASTVHRVLTRHQLNRLR